MKIFSYDRTFSGFLSLVFYAYSSKIFPDKILSFESFQDDLFADTYEIATNEQNAKRVWKGIEKKASKLVGQKIHRAFLSEIPEIEILILRYIRIIFESQSFISGDYGDDTVLELEKIYLKVSKEAHRAVMFIRFQKTTDGIYYAPFDPAYNIIPLTINHFKDRFADQQWVIYDTHRDYGFYYDLENVQMIQMTDIQASKQTGKIKHEILDEKELCFQELWSTYYKATAIKDRKNPKLRQQFLPKRFWKYLPEINFR